jgi:hypothetical protein
MAREAWRNLTSGTTRAVLWAFVLAAVLGLLGWADAGQVAGVVHESVAYIQGGGSTWILEAPGRIDGATCDRLGAATSVHGSGALRQRPQVLRLISLPSAPLQEYDATPGWAALLGAPAASGVLLPNPIAAQLGVAAGDQVATADGDTPLGGTYAYPEDGRRTGLGYAAVTPVPAMGAFDECWIRVWPVDLATIGLVRMALIAGAEGPDQPSPKLSQLNSSLASEFAAAERFRDRPTRLAPLVALGAGLLVGFGSLLTRRLELASALHCGVGRGPLLWQVAQEGAAWIFGAAILAAPAVVLTAYGAAADTARIAVLGLRSVLAGACGALLGVLASVMWIRERHLFALFKNR